MKTAAEKFLDEIEAFLAESGMSATALGKEALKDPKFVFDVREGRKVNLDIVQRVHDFMFKRQMELSQ